MASLYPRGNVWWVSWKPPGKKRRLDSTSHALDQRVQAEEVCARFTLLEKQAKALLPRTRTLGDVLREFLDAKALETEAKTHQGYRTHAANFQATRIPGEREIPLAAGKPFEAITATDIRAYLRARVSGDPDARDAEGKPAPIRPVAVSTANGERMTLLILWNWAQANEITERNPVAATKPLPLPRGTRRRQPYPVGELVALLAALRAEAASTRAQKPKPTKGEQSLVDRHAHGCDLFADLCEACYWTGWRLGEGCSLKRAEVDLKRGVIPLSSAANKGGESELPIPAAVLKILKRRAALGGEYLFGDIDGKHGRVSIENFWRRWGNPDKHPEHARFADFTMHRLRHTYTTDLEKLRERDTVRRALTRHRSLQAHAIYLHADAEDLRAAQERLATSRQLALGQATEPRSDPPSP